MARRKSQSVKRRTAAQTRRVRTVWLSLMGAMTCVGGLLLLVDGRTASANAEGLTLTPLAASTTSTSLESIFQTRAPLAKDKWTSIVIHHSGQPAGSPASIEAEHRAAGFRGLGHHFIVGNGRGNMEDGELNVGYRWRDQLSGAHAGGPQGDFYNNHAISICLVGDGNRQQFTRAQLQRLDALVNALCQQFQIPADRVVLHRDIAPTADPGRLFPEAWLKQRVTTPR